MRPGPLPRWDLNARPFQRFGAADDSCDIAGSHLCALSRLDYRSSFTRCLHFTPAVFDEPRKTRFRLLARLYRVGLGTHRALSRSFSFSSSSFTSSSHRLLVVPHVRGNDFTAEEIGHSGVT